MARPKRQCPFHKDDTASLVRYTKNWYCHGACGKTYSLEEVAGKGIECVYEGDEDDKEDVEERFRYIESLPRTLVRGLLLPTDERGYFICWPNREYYKYRLFVPGKGPKYIGPKGHKTPLLWAKRAKTPDSLWIVEGEINALSVAEVVSGTVCSPGSASCFTSDNLARHLTEFKKYSRIKIVVDHDAAGIKALIESKAFFLYKIPFVTYLQMSVDANDVLVGEGPEKLRRILYGENCE